MGDEILLQFGDFRHSFLLHQGLAGGRTLPGAVRHLVASHMDGFQRDPGFLVQGDDSVKYLVYECVSGREGDIQDVVREVLGGNILGSVLRFGQQIGPVAGRPGAVIHRLDSCAGMPRGVELRNHPDPAFPGIAEQVDVVFLRIIPVGRRAGVIPVQGAAETRHEGLFFVDGTILLQLRNAPEGAIGRQFGKTVDLHAPAFVVAQMEVQVIQFVMGHDVQKSLDILLLREVPAHIQHDAAVREVRAVFDDGGGDGLPGRIPAQVLQRDGRPEGTVLIGRLHLDRVRYGNPVPPRLLSRDVCRLGDIDLADSHGPAARGDAFQPGNHVIDIRFHGIVGKGMDGLDGLENILQRHGDGLFPLFLEVEGLRRPALVHQTRCFIAERHRLSLRIRGRNHPQQRSCDVFDGGGSPLFHPERCAELTEPQRPVRSGGRVLDLQLMDGGPGLRIHGSLRPDDGTGFCTGTRQEQGAKKIEEGFCLHGQSVSVFKFKDGIFSGVKE